MMYYTPEYAWLPRMPVCAEWQVLTLRQASGMQRALDYLLLVPNTGHNMVPQGMLLFKMQNLINYEVIEKNVLYVSLKVLARY